MHIKLLKHVLVGAADVMPTARGTVVEVPDAQGKEFIAGELAEEVKAPKAKEPAKDKEASEPQQKEAPAPENKMAAAPANKAATKEPKAK